MAGIALGILAGCDSHRPPAGPSLAKAYPVHGKVSFAGGTPLKGGIITFVPNVIEVGRELRFEGSGLVDASGNYKVGLAGIDGGIAAGDYKVVVEPRDYRELKNSNSSKIPNKYRNKVETPLTATVKEEENVFNFELK
jgi:hypothetical protein